MSDDLSDLGNGNCGKIIYYDGTNDILELPTREILYKNDKLFNDVERAIEYSEPILFMPITILDNTNYSPTKHYEIKIYGTLQDGSKAEVNISDIKVFFDILVPTNQNIEAFDQKIRNVIYECFCDRHSYYNIEDIYALPLHGFNTEKKLFKRIYTNDTYDRSILLKRFNSLSYDTYSNDESYTYYFKAARENKLSLSDWVKISNYEYKKGPTKYSPLCSHIFSVSQNNYIKLQDNDPERSLPEIIKDRSLVMTWDIETYSDRQTGELPNPKYNEDIVFMICMTIHWVHDSNALYKICISDKEVEPDSRWTTIVCNHEINVIKALAICWNHFRPDIFIGFNDSFYDWPFVMGKAIRYNIVSWIFEKMSAKYFSTLDNNTIINKYYIRSNANHSRVIKINSEKVFYSDFLNVPGTTIIDCLPCFMKIYPREEISGWGSLKFYLKDNNLPSKVDLPVQTLWKYYKSDNPTNMREIAYYCMVDTISVQRLFVKRNIVTDYREVASLAYISLADSHYRAGGMKVCNLVGSYAWPNILINTSNLHSREHKNYPGAYVFPPEKGIVPNIKRLNDLIENPNKEEAIQNFAIDRPVSCLDFASLYPSLIMTYNLSPEKILSNENEYLQYKDLYSLHKIDFNLDTGEKIIGWSINHNNSISDMGLFPIILKTLFDKRKEMKKILKNCTDKKEIYELIFSKNCDYAIAIESIKQQFNSELSKTVTVVPPGSTMEEEIDILNKHKNNISHMLNIISKISIDNIQQDYENICFEKNYIDKKQNALKIYMNTFYGETGNQSSFCYMIALAGGVTSSGRENIVLAANFAKNNGFHVKYGDTDSLYLTCPNSYFKECDIKYISGEYTRQDFYSAMVKISFRVIANLEQKINDYLEKITGTKFLKMENEGCLYPCVFLGKKKYFGIQHINEVNFTPKKLYIKGIDVIKQGKSTLEKKIGFKIMETAVSINNNLDMMEIVKDNISDAINNKWNIEDFIQTSSWKPDVSNIANQIFMKRMEARHELEIQENERLISKGLPPKEYLYKKLEPGERFKYVLVQPTEIYNLRGNIINIKTGNLMEYAHVAKQENMPIYVTHYMKHFVVGICARFINFDDQFKSNIHMDDKALDEYSRKKASEFLNNYIDELVGNSKKDRLEKGKECKNIFKNAVSQYIQNIPIIHQIVAKESLVKLISLNEDSDKTKIDTLFECAEKYAIRMYKKYNYYYCSNMCLLYNIDPNTGLNIIDYKKSTNLYKLIDSLKRSHSNNNEYLLRKKISQTLLTDVSVKFEADIKYITDKMKNNESDFNINNIKIYTDLSKIWFEIVGIKLVTISRNLLLEYLNELKHKLTKTSKKITKQEINTCINEIISRS